MATLRAVREWKAQIAGESAAREKAEAIARLETERADRAERSERDLTRDLDAWKRRALHAEAQLKSIGMEVADGQRS